MLYLRKVLHKGNAQKHIPNASKISSFSVSISEAVLFCLFVGLRVCSKLPVPVGRVVLPVLVVLVVLGVLGVLLVLPFPYSRYFPYWTWQRFRYLLYSERWFYTIAEKSKR